MYAVYTIYIKLFTVNVHFYTLYLFISDAIKM